MKKPTTVLKNIFSLAGVLFGFGLFSIQPALADLKVTSPVAGQVWNTGSIQTIIWIPNPPSSGTYGSNPAVDIQLNPASCATAMSTNSCPPGASTTPLIIAINAPDSGSYSWNIPTTLAQAYLGQATISISELSNGSTQADSAEFTLAAGTAGSSSPASIAAGPFTSSPVAGTSWPSQSNQTIMWPSASSSAANVIIQLIPAGGPSTTPIVITTSAPNTGSFSWNIGQSGNGQSVPTGQYTLKVLDASNNNLVAQSPGNFTITGAAPYISDLNPNTGPVGTSVGVGGTNFTPAGNTVQFGPNDYINNLSSDNNGSLSFTVPSQTQPCPTQTATSVCQAMTALITPGVYGVTVTNSNGTSNTLPFTVATGTGPSIISPAVPITPIIFPNGSLVKVNTGPTVYIVSGTTFIPFTSPQIFFANGYQWSQVQVIQPGQFVPQMVSPVSATVPNGSIVKSASSPTIYLITNGQKSAIPSLTDLNRLNYSLDKLIILSDQEIQNYPAGPDQP